MPQSECLFSPPSIQTNHILVTVLLRHQNMEIPQSFVVPQYIPPLHPIRIQSLCHVSIQNALIPGGLFFSHAQDILSLPLIILVTLYFLSERISVPSFVLLVKSKHLSVFRRCQNHIAATLLIPELWPTRDDPPSDQSHVRLSHMKQIMYTHITVGPVLIAQFNYCVFLFLATSEFNNCIRANCTQGWAFNRISLRI